MAEPPKKYGDSIVFVTGNVKCQIIKIHNKYEYFLDKLTNFAQLLFDLYMVLLFQQLPAVQIKEECR